MCWEGGSSPATRAGGPGRPGPPCAAAPPRAGAPSRRGHQFLRVDLSAKRKNQLNTGHGSDGTGGAGTAEEDANGNMPAVKLSI